MKKIKRAENVLTKREAEVAALIALGFLQKEIADILFICLKTIKFHSSNIYRKLNVSSRAVFQTKYLMRTFSDEQMRFIDPYFEAHLLKAKPEVKEKYCLPKGFGQ